MNNNMHALQKNWKPDKKRSERVKKVVQYLEGRREKCWLTERQGYDSSQFYPHASWPDLPLLMEGFVSSCWDLVSRVGGTTQLLEDNLSPLILSPMWWHSLTSTICWNTSQSSQHHAVSRTPLPCPITDRLLGGSSLPGGRDKDTAQRRGRHTHTHSRSHHCLHPTLTQTLYEMRARKPPSHRNLRGRVGRGEWVEEEGEGSKQGRGERVRERGTCLRAKVGKIERYNLYLSHYVAGNVA